MSDPPHPSRLTCPVCHFKAKSLAGLMRHKQVHNSPTPPPDDSYTQFSYVHHKVFTGVATNSQPYNSWHPFRDRHSFDFANFYFTKIQASEGQINEALDMWAATTLNNHDPQSCTPWDNANELYSTIDAIQCGSCPWNSYNIQYCGPKPEVNLPAWMTETYQLCTRSSRDLLCEQFSNSDFKDSIHYAPYMQFKDGRRVRSDFMSADWAWDQCDDMSHLPGSQDAMFIPIIAGSDKTTVSVATGHQEYHPVYMSPGNLTNTAHRSRGNAVLPVAFLPIPKTSKKHRKSKAFKTFIRQLFHACLVKIFSPLEPGMTTPELILCPDGCFRRAFYGLGPYIADYPEQVWLSGIIQNWCPKCDAHPHFLDAPGSRPRSHEMTEFLITCFDPGPFTSFFPRANIHELLSPDLLHQVIKGTFRDHIVEWVSAYILGEYKPRGDDVLQDIDHRISAVPPFPELRRFPDGRDFKQWTGDDSKALMKVYLTAITGYVPAHMVQCVSAFLDFCYISRRNSFESHDLQELQDALNRFHKYHDVFIQPGVRDNVSLPQSKHIKAVKEPWRCSSRYNALIQMLRTITRLEKLSSLASEFDRHGMLDGSTYSYTRMIQGGGFPEPKERLGGSDIEGDEEDDFELGLSSAPCATASVKLAKKAEPVKSYPRNLEALAARIEQPCFPDILHRFLWEMCNPGSDTPVEAIPAQQLPRIYSKVHVYHSALARFYAPSDQGGKYPRRDTVFVKLDQERDGMCSMVVAHILLFFSFTHASTLYSCALVNWFPRVSNDPDPITSLWQVEPEFDSLQQRALAVIHVDSIVRGAHLLPAYGSDPLPEDFHFTLSLDVFHLYFVNKYIDHHSHSLLHNK
ncbi:hypothetical protein BDQ17DRAFT_1387964 [Cyathus striatus]|nr:hypothetical protein BDQ17DRAFT_1387964 [Cyathus striatus]